MRDDTFKLRVLVAKEPCANDNRDPIVFAGISDDTWEVMPPEEWDEEKRKFAETWLGPDWTTYDFAEAILCIPVDALRGLFSPPIPVTVEKA